ncbi:MAG: hypothetical protein IPF44_06235 [Betaproteobacteria bacterium]|nr:hypothetical protein [Betaproteobacteria bacterium]
MREQRVVTQGHGGGSQVAVREVFEIQADQVAHARHGAFQIGAQIGGAEMVGDLDDALGRIGFDAGHGFARQDALRQPEADGFLEIRAVIDDRD